MVLFPNKPNLMQHELHGVLVYGKEISCSCGRRAGGGDGNAPGAAGAEIPPGQLEAVSP